MYEWEWIFHLQQNMDILVSKWLGYLTLSDKSIITIPSLTIL